jgi:hypothetical protein
LNRDFVTRIDNVAASVVSYFSLMKTATPLYLESRGMCAVIGGVRVGIAEACG